MKARVAQGGEQRELPGGEGVRRGPGGDRERGCREGGGCAYIYFNGVKARATPGNPASILYTYIS